MNNLVIDSSIYRKDMSRQKSGFSLLKRLARQELVRLHIPEVVKKEVVSQIEDFHYGRFRKVESALDKAPRFLLNDKETGLLDSTQAGFSELIEKIAKRTKTEFQNWLDAVRANVHPVSPNHGERVVQSYFAGEPPFAEAKSRKDFPDAFIFESLVDLRDQHGSIHFIVADNDLREASDALENVTVHDSIKHFVDTSPQLKKDLSNREERAFFSELRVQLEDDLLPEVRREIEKSVSEGIVRELFLTDVESEYTPSGTKIEDLEERLTMDFEYNRMTLYGNGEAVVPFTSEYSGVLSWTQLYDGRYPELERGKHRERWQTGNGRPPMVEVAERFLISIDGEAEVSIEGVEYHDIEVSDEEAYLNSLRASLDSIDHVEVVEPH
jgi:hypothetical protein